jgi:hypothetical protein
MRQPTSHSHRAIAAKFRRRAPKFSVWRAAAFSWIVAITTAAATDSGGIRPPSVPLVANDPYFSIWSPADRSTDRDTVHWTGKPQRLRAMARIDGRTFRVMGSDPQAVPPLSQLSVQVLPTRTIYTFETNAMRLTLTFMTAALPDDLMIYSRPVTYVTCQFAATDDQKHDASFYFDASAAIAVNDSSQVVKWDPITTRIAGGFMAGTTEQPVLAKKGDDLRIDWGHFAIVCRKGNDYSRNLGAPSFGRDSFVQGLIVPTRGIAVGQAPASDAPVASFVFDFPGVGQKPQAKHLILAYDDEFSIQYFKQNLRPYWRRKGGNLKTLLESAESDYDSLSRRCEKFDSEVMDATTKAGGIAYANLCALAYRQCYAANKVVADANGQPLMFPKENFSNGCIGTVDVIYPMSPQFLFFSPSLTKAILVPILDYAGSSRWRFPFAPHDLGTYPRANGQVYGGGERTEENQMPVEETGNMILMLAALAQEEGNAKFCDAYWPVLKKWADYLLAKGFDPENQLCTDDFAGHLAHNVNLSAKAICGLGAYAKLCEMHGDRKTAAEFIGKAKEFAVKWLKAADDGDHYRLAFDKPGTWSQKYNLVWDRILGLNLFPDSVREKEMAFYKGRENRFGLPLDNRKEYTKLDWTLWTATLTQQRSDFEALLNPVCAFLNATTNRVPMTDWYWTTDARKAGFQARSVVGGVFLQMLYDRREWKAFASRDKTHPSHWAALPQAAATIVVAPTSEGRGQRWRYTFEKPADKWTTVDFDDHAWKEGRGGFGTKGTPGAIVGTTWDKPDIWLRRSFTIYKAAIKHPLLRIHHDEDAEVYIDGTEVGTFGGFISDYENEPLSAEGAKMLTPGNHELAAHCHQTTGGQYIDVGLEYETGGK